MPQDVRQATSYFHALSARARLFGKNALCGETCVVSGGLLSCLLLTTMNRTDVHGYKKVQAGADVARGAYMMVGLLNSGRPCASMSTGNRNFVSGNRILL